ncbi:MAG: bifunctional 23S rRNA (guanine(2069)-N(7))-methyltransferase RlmK/23S rRNA (guanine(2445)-N(2))-methyltransferase RlmL [Actinomycetota bacterium]|nr:bifunctional 23S rRNA (guanine(2069)-N(7))-methyltransferase RlmK/23S rRNA (guanine(2445)-N(2))-methyltransferase RlmL [Actinomycetota bacterium]
MTRALDLFAPAPKGLEAVLAEELAALGATEVQPVRAGASFRGDLATAYRACLWSRTASRVLLKLAMVNALDADALYARLRDLPWEKHLDASRTLAVDFVGSGAGVTNTMFGALKVKDAVVDRLRDLYGERPSVDAVSPDVRINVRVAGDRAIVSLDLAGDPLHRRGYREPGVQVEAPLKENMAAAVLLMAGWPAIAGDGGGFVDPMCGSGTLPIEAAMIAGDVAPGILRQRWGFSGWLGHDADAWDDLLAEADDRAEAGREKLPPIVGYDIDPRAVEVASACVRRAGFGASVRIEDGDVRDCVPPAGAQCGLMATNPPWGERLGGDVGAAYAALGERLRGPFAGWSGAAIAPDESLVLRVGRRVSARHSLHAGKIPVTLAVFAAGVGDDSSADLSAGQEMFANRLRKNLKLRAKEARREGVTCYRVYDADMPEYSLAVDIYEGAGDDAGRRWAHIAEYEAPPTVDADAADRRRDEAVDVVPKVLGMEREDCYLKVRRRQRGSDQYERLEGAREFHTVAESGLLLRVNFRDYLDTGLFLDHRLTRAMLRDAASGARFLNLFAYTGVASVYAAAGGASSTTTVDMSATYMDWARENMAANGFGGTEHVFVQADALTWLADEGARRGAAYDLIFCDPPTFSNSKRMEDSFDVQRDHVVLIHAVAALLAPGGTLIFSNNRRKFRMDTEALTGLTAEDITAETIPFDFARRPGVHSTWRIARG